MTTYTTVSRNIAIGDLSFDMSRDEFGGIGKVRCKAYLIKMAHNTMADPGFVVALLPILGAAQKVTDPVSKREFEISEADGAIVTFMKLGEMTPVTLNALNAMGWKALPDKGVTGEDFEDFALGLSAADMDMGKDVDATLEVNTFTSKGKTYSNIRVKYINPVDLSIKKEGAQSETAKYKDLIKKSKAGPLKMEKKDKAPEAQAPAAGGGNVSPAASGGGTAPPTRDAPADGTAPAAGGTDIPF